MRYSELNESIFTINRPIIAYHATHKGPDLILKNREVKTYDSMGTWLSSDKELVKELYGPHVSAYELPKGNYFRPRQDMELWATMLTCLPFIRKHVGNEAAEHLEEFPWDGKNRRFLKRVEDRARQLFPDDGIHGAVINMLNRWHKKGLVAQFQRYKALKQSQKYYTQVATSPGYNQAFRDFLSQTYVGIVWENRQWDSHDRHTVYLVFHEEDLHPITDPAQAPSEDSPAALGTRPA